MKKINRLLINISTTRLKESKAFYTTLFDLKVEFDSDWFVNLISTDKNYEIGIIDRNNDIVPNESKQEINGLYLTFVVDDADSLYDVAQKSGYNVLQKPHDTFYGQRRLLLKDPDGLVVDVSSPIPDFQFQK
ncbi:MAG: VOC family protein [Bacteroidota bacterium]